MSIYLMDPLASDLRRLSLSIVFSSYRPNISVSYLLDILGFEKNHSLMEFLREHHVVFAKNLAGEPQIDSKTSLIELNKYFPLSRPEAKKEDNNKVDASLVIDDDQFWAEFGSKETKKQKKEKKKKKIVQMDDIDSGSDLDTDQLQKHQINNHITVTSDMITTVLSFDIDVELEYLNPEQIKSQYKELKVLLKTRTLSSDLLDRVQKRVKLLKKRKTKIKKKHLKRKLKKLLQNQNQMSN